MAAPKGHPPYRNADGELAGGRPVEWTDERIEKEAEALLEWIKEPKNFYWEEFAIQRGFPAHYMSRLAKKNVRFKQAYELARMVQKMTISKNAMFKKFDSSFCRWFLACNYGMREGEDTSGLDDEKEAASVKALRDTKKVCIDHADFVEQASNKLRES